MSQSNNTASAHSLFQDGGPLEDLISHRDAWRTALQYCRDQAVDERDHANASYYEHELKVFDRVHDALSKLIDGQNASTSEHSGVQPAPQA